MHKEVILGYWMMHDLIEKENPKQLRGVLPKVYTRAPLDPHTLGEIVNLIGILNLKKIMRMTYWVESMNIFRKICPAGGQRGAVNFYARECC